MFSNLYNVYSKLKRPSSLIWLNIWKYSNNNTWYYLSSELLTFYIESLRGFKSITITTFQIFPQILYKYSFIALLFIHAGLLVG